jgi:hypothetical protein
MVSKSKKGDGARRKLRQHFLDNVGKVMHADELRSVAQISEWARRIRELRTEEGYQILTHNDRSGLKPGEYVLEDPIPLPAFERNISKEMRAYVLDHNGFTYQICGAVAGEEHPYDPTRKTRLHIGHIVDKSMGGTDDPSNLRAECSVCNEGGSNLRPDRPTALKLLTQIRKSSSTEQLEVLKWLIKKFPNQAKSFIDE